MKNIKNQELPPIYERNGKKCYLDPIRQKLIYITPEETVRQRVISWLLKELKVPKDMISVEEHLAHYGVKSKRRADIVIHEFDEEHEQRLPIAVIECKAEGIFLGENVANQVMDYTDTVKCDYAMITDGEATFCFKYNGRLDKYDAIECLPEYENMLDGKYKLFEPGEMPARIPFAEIADKIDLYVGWDIGRSTSKEKAAVMVNLLECLLDPHHIMPSGEYRTFSLIEDYGVRLLTYGNAGGGSFSGPYRSFLIEVDGNTEFVSMGISSYYLSSKEGSEKTAICVAIDNEKDTHHSLQLSVDDNMVIVGEKVSI